jgi:Xaa-Pro aminopeptidase
VRTYDYQIAREKLQQSVRLLNENHIDTWLILTREGTDSSVPLLFGTRSVHQAAIFINRTGEHVAITSVSDQGSYEQSELFSEVIPYHSDMDETFMKYFEKLNPNKMALNISEDDHLCDGLTLGLYMWLEQCIGTNQLNQIEVSSQSILKQLRSIKSPTELEYLQKAIDLTNEIYEEAFQNIRCGMTEIEIGQLFVDGMKKRGVTNGLDNPYDPPMVCIVRKGLAHRKPADYETEPGDIVIIDFSLNYNQYKSDIARTIYFLKHGETRPPQDIQQAFDTAIEAITASINELMPGKKGFEVDAVGRSVIEGHQYPTIRHAVGHQIGRETHDGGTVLGPQRKPSRPNVEGIVQNGEVYAIEPTVIQDDGLPCILVEENVLVTASEPKIMSKRQMELVTIAD